MRKLSPTESVNLLVLVSLFLVTGWYLWDSWQASTEIYNLIFVLPLTVSILVLCILTFCKDLLKPPRDPEEIQIELQKEAQEGAPVWNHDEIQEELQEERQQNIAIAAANEQQNQPETSTLPVILLFVGYVATLPWLGFDVGTFVFVALFLFLAGEQKWQWILGYSLTFAFSSALFFSNMLPYPMPLLLLSGGN